MTLSPPETPPQTGGSSLEHLHKMSRTAGLGSTDYVAVNTTAVAALILGLLSGLSLLGTILLVLPVATLAVGIIAIWQIRKSAGTQSGIAIAVLGLLLAFGFVGAVGGKEVLQERKDAVEQAQVVALIQKFGQNIAAKDYTSAWNAFTERSRSKSSQTAFSDLWARVQASTFYGAVKKMDSNGIVVIIRDPDTNSTGGRGVVVISLAEGKEDRREATFAKTPDGVWEFDDLQGFGPPALTPAAAKPPGQ